MTPGTGTILLLTVFELVVVAAFGRCIIVWGLFAVCLRCVCGVFAVWVFGYIVIP